MVVEVVMVSLVRVETRLSMAGEGGWVCSLRRRTHRLTASFTAGIADVVAFSLCCWDDVFVFVVADFPKSPHSFCRPRTS